MKTKYDHLSKEDLINQLVKRDSERKLGLVWERDQIEHERALNDDFVALDYIPEHSVGAAPFQNLLIEGDNFDALRYLSIAYKGKVKCICIDPPYNTGNKDFIYNDRFLDKEDNWKHSKWLEFMYRRLDRAKELLADNGVILVCINDENRAKLELLMDQVFKGMRLGSFVWRSRTGGNDTGGAFLSINHEHVLVYGGKDFSFSGDEKNYSMYKFQEGDRLFQPIDLGSPKDMTERPNTYYPIHDPETDTWYPCNPDRVWAYASRDRVKQGQKTRGDTMEELIEQKMIWFPKNQRIEVYPATEVLLAAIDSGDVPKSGNTYLLRRDLPSMDFWVNKRIGFGRPRLKRFKETLKNDNQPISTWLTPRREADTAVEELNMPIVGATEEGSKLIKEILGNKAFNYPKPVTLIQSLIAQAANNDDLVLDFFAGSGSTAHAVLNLNSEDEGNRRFIMVSSTEATAVEPDKNICRDVCSKRIKGVIEGYGTTTGTGGNFAYLRTRRLPFETLHLEIQHDQIWYALQLIHSGGISPYSQDDAIQKSESEKSIILYLPELSPATINAVLETADKTTIPTVIYTWQPGTLAPQTHNEQVTIEKIPEYLVQRFGGGEK